MKLLKNVSNKPLAISCIGIGNGDFSDMELFDDCSGRIIDNFQFTNMNDVCSIENLNERERELWYHMFMEIPSHYRQCKKLLNYQPKKDVVNIFRQNELIGNAPNIYQSVNY